MWHFISEQISQKIERDFICDDIRDIQSGDTNKAYRIADDSRRFFVKTNQASQLDLFETEAHSLEHLRQAGTCKIPKVICSGIVGEHSFLVLEYINLQDAQGSDWQALGASLAQLHKHNTQAMYGWQEDNYIGLTPQPNHWAKKWNQFFAEQRIGFMLQLLAERGHQLVNIDQAVETVKTLLAGHQPEASMLHGDLWSGNVGFNRHHPVLFDPALYFGDRETDLAMTELFSRFPNGFYDSYHASWPIDEGYLFRKPIYQLYHLLNHGILFGGYYLDTARTVLNNLEK